MDGKTLDVIATVIECCEDPRGRQVGHPPAETVRVLGSLRRFLREGTPWRSLTATTEQASGSPLRRWLTRWGETDVLGRVHAMLVSMLRGHPDLILNTCSVRAKRGGDLTGPNPTDNVNDTLVFERLFRAAFAVMGGLPRDSHGPHPHRVRGQRV